MSAYAYVCAHIPSYTSKYIERVQNVLYTYAYMCMCVHACVSVRCVRERERECVYMNRSIYTDIVSVHTYEHMYTYTYVQIS